jgi:U3 small nucleolar RNA-associated protein 16
MFAHVLDTAKRILSRSPSFQGRAEESDDPTPRDLEPDTDAVMVTTRRGTGVDVPGESTPRSSTRKGRGKRELKALEIEDTPTAAKRRRKSVGTKDQPKQEVGEEDIKATTEAPEPSVAAQNEADIQEQISDTIVVAIPDRTKGQSSSPFQERKTPPSRRGSPKVIIHKRLSPQASAEPSYTKTTPGEDLVPTQETPFHTPVVQPPSSAFATPDTQMERAGSPTPKPSTQSSKRTPRSTRNSARRNKMAEPTSETKDAPMPKFNLPDEIPSSTWGSEQAPIATQDSVSTSTPSAKEMHKRFGSEEPSDLAVPILMNGAPEVPREQGAHIGKVELDDDASDSDEAPDMVTTATAASKARAAAETTSRAHQAQQEKEERRKRQRADRIAEEQAEKRKRDEHKAKKLAKRQAREKRMNRSNSTPPRAPLDVDMSALPALLPDSILEAAGDRRPASPPPVRTGKTAEQLRKEKLNRHIKFLDRGEKPVKDVKKGSLNVSVLAQQNTLLAPKVNRATKNMREHWLKGRQQEKKAKKGLQKGQFKKMERRAVGGGGFLRGGDD